MRVAPFLLLLFIPQLAYAGECGISRDAVVKTLDGLQTNYGDVLSDISCDAPTNPAHVLLCDASYESDADLWKMGLLDTAASVYAYENATKTETDHDDPPLDAAFIEKRDACEDVTCLCDTLIQHTNDSLGGMSPYLKPSA